ncbi:MAG: YlxR family protein [Chloroflexi bacterium]|nr:MAG: YlxR family protein [Chloroflexota bacterium]
MSKKKQTKTRHVPHRTCVACRQKTDKRQLTRIVRTPEGNIIIDPTGKQNGRGAYVCHKTECWHKIVQNARILGHALKTELTSADLAYLAENQPETME